VGELITEEQAIQAGIALQTAMNALANTAGLVESHGEVVSSLVRMQSLRSLDAVLENKQIAALVLSGANSSYEVAESDNFKLTDAQIMQGVRIALHKRYLLSDEHGPHFTVFAGKKGAVSVTIKERGHRYKLSKAGCSNIQVHAISRGIRQRANNAAKHEIVFDGKASCVLDGRTIEVNRTGDFPLVLPCYESDGSDGHEAKARRRLLSSLWSVVAGEPAEQDEDDDAASVTVAPVKTLEMPDTVMITNQTSVENVWAKERQLLKSDSARTAWDAIAESKSAADVSKSMARASASVKAGTITAQDFQSLNRLADSRISELAAGVA
jgi:hypothetical protein